MNSNINISYAQQSGNVSINEFVQDAGQLSRNSDGFFKNILNDNEPSINPNDLGNKIAHSIDPNAPGSIVSYVG